MSCAFSGCEATLKAKEMGQHYQQLIDSADLQTIPEEQELEYQIKQNGWQVSESVVLRGGGNEIGMVRGSYERYIFHELLMD